MRWRWGGAGREVDCDNREKILGDVGKDGEKEKQRRNGRRGRLREKDR